jgi:tetratricopeptide (TPR) repeat protein
MKSSTDPASGMEILSFPYLRFSLVFAALLALFFARPAFSATQVQPSDDAFEKTMANWISDSLTVENYSRALDLSRVSIFFYPRNPNLYAVRAQINVRMGRWDDALDDYDRAVVLAPNDPLFHEGRGVVYAMMGDINTAIDDLDRAAELGSDDPSVYYFRGLFYLSRMRYARAEEEFSAAIKRNPAHADALARRALCRYLQGRIIAARDDLEAALSADPKSVDALNLYGVLLSVVGDNKAGIAALLRARNIDPKFSGIYVNLAYIEFQRGNTAKAAEYLDASLKAEPGNAYAVCNYAEMLIHERKWEDARTYAGRCLIAGRDNNAFWRDLRRYLRAMKRAGEAMSSTSGVPDYDTLVREGDAAFEDGDYERAYPAYALALMLDFTKPRLLYRMGLTCLYVEEIHHAASFFYQAVQLAPSDLDAQKAKIQIDRLETGR